jgi:O-succinylbenzoate synthase
MNLQTFFDRPLKLKRLELNLIDLPQRETFRSAVGVRTSRQALILRYYDANGGYGVSECSCRIDPYYSHEFLRSVEQLITDFIYPRLNQVANFGELVAFLGQIRGWTFTKACVIEAICDWWRRSGQKDPVEVWKAPQLERIPVGISLGLFESTKAAIDRVAREFESGYTRIKLKIKPGLPANYLADVRQAFPEAPIGVDANGSFGETHVEELARLEALNLLMIEQPFAPDRLDLCAKLKQAAPGVNLCLDESVSGAGHLHTAHALGSVDELNLKPGRVGGQLTSIELSDLCESMNIPVWIGGMFETGIGRSSNLRIAARFPQAIGHDLSPSMRYFVEDIVEEPPIMDTNGTIALPVEPPRISETKLNKYRVHQTVLKGG